MLLTVFYLLVALAGLTLGAEALVRGSVSLARRLGVSSFFIGLTIVGFGTSAPELATGIASSLRGQTDLAIGNAVGSNIFNIAFILGLTALIAPVPVLMKSVRREVLTVLLISFLPFIFMITGTGITRLEGAVLVGLLLVVVGLQYRQGREELAPPPLQDALESVALAPPPQHWFQGVLFTVIGIVMLVAFSQLLVYSAVEIARWSGLSELVIALTVVAAGTSAPELFTSAMAAFRKQSDISVGNILGSNIFNMLGIIGAAAMVAPQRFNPQVMWLDAPVMLLFSAACLPIMLSHHRISRTEGGVLLAGYVVYLVIILRYAPGWF
jgi:cation:H+ antiporter